MENTLLESKNKIIRRAIFAVLLLITFMFQNTGVLFPAPAGIHALLLLPLTVCLGMFEREFAGLFFGLFAGAMLDAFSSNTICYHSIAFTLFGFAAGALTTYLMRNNLLCAIILTAIFTFMHNTVYFLIYCTFNGGENQILVYLRYFFLSVLYTVIFTPIYYFIIRSVTKRLK
ncbi:MAG: hypothetical protein MJ168_11295 [Clostridia bacterium]|nr:hypothetical protein [Clostridia bacterium]